VLNAAAFDDRVDAVCRQIVQVFGSSIGPADLDGIQLALAAQAEMQAQIVLGKIAGAATHFTKLAELASLECETGADGGAVAPDAFELEEYAMV